MRSEEQEAKSLLKRTQGTVRLGKGREGKEGVTVGANGENGG